MQGHSTPSPPDYSFLCCGKMTKSIQEFQGQEKAYSGEFLLGATTPSYDLETEVDQQFPTDHITPTAVAAAKEKNLLGK